MQFWQPINENVLHSLIHSNYIFIFLDRLSVKVIEKSQYFTSSDRILPVLSMSCLIIMILYSPFSKLSIVNDKSYLQVQLVSMVDFSVKIIVDPTTLNPVSITASQERMVFSCIICNLLLSLVNNLICSSGKSFVVVVTLPEGLLVAGVAPEMYFLHPELLKLLKYG